MDIFRSYCLSTQYIPSNRGSTINFGELGCFALWVDCRHCDECDGDMYCVVILSTVNQSGVYFDFGWTWGGVMLCLMTGGRLYDNKKIF